MMKDIAWTIFLFATTVFCLRIVTNTTLTLDSNPIGAGFLIAYFTAAPLGAFWMLHDSWKVERKVTARMLLSIVPYGFLYYYFNYVRPRRARQSNER